MLICGSFAQLLLYRSISFFSNDIKNSMYYVTRFAVIILFLVFHVNAQNNATSNQHYAITHTHTRPKLAIAIGVLSILFSITFFILAYGKFIISAIFGEPTNIIDQEIDITLEIFQQPVSRFSGIDRRVIQSLPLFKFSNLKGPKDGLECAVCLSKFQEIETLRLMPRCRHAFHIDCIDTWLEQHSSCPICRDRFEADDLTKFPCTNSLRYFPTSSTSFNQTEQQNVQIFVEREVDDGGRSSSRFNMMFGSVKRLALGWKEEQLLQKESSCGGNGNHLHKFKHTIIVSDLICKNRWSDLNSSDLTFLNSEMLNYLSSKRFSTTKSHSFHGEFRMNEDMMKIKEDIERKRNFELRVGNIINSASCVEDQTGAASSNLLNPAEKKRAMSEIVYLPRGGGGGNFNPRLRNNYMEVVPMLSRNERIRRLWLPIARRTLQWFNNGRESALEFKKSPINV